MARIFKDKFSKTIIKTSKQSPGFIASTYMNNGDYVGCKHLRTKADVEFYIKYILSDCEEVTE